MYTVQRLLTTHCSFKAVSLKTALAVGKNSGQNVVLRKEEEVRRLHLPKFSSQVNQWPCPLNDLLQQRLQVMWSGPAPAHTPTQTHPHILEAQNRFHGGHRRPFYQPQNRHSEPLAHAPWFPHIPLRKYKCNDKLIKNQNSMCSTLNLKY